jgi:hypothetical protein
MVLLSKFFDWPEALVVVKPETCLKWHRTPFRAFWSWKSGRRGRPRLPKNLRELIREMAHDHLTWGPGTNRRRTESQAGHPSLARTVSKYWGRIGPGGGRTDQCWATFVRNQAKAIVACDFFVSITVTFRLLYVFVAIEIGSRRILHCHVRSIPSQSGPHSNSVRFSRTCIRTGSSFTIAIRSFRLRSTRR